MEDWHKMGGVSVSPAEKLLNTLSTVADIDDLRSEICAVDESWGSVTTLEHLEVKLRARIQEEALRKSSATAAPTESVTRFAVAHWGKLTFLSTNHKAVLCFMTKEKESKKVPASLLLLFDELSDSATLCQINDVLHSTKPVHEFIKTVGDTGRPVAHLVSNKLSGALKQLRRDCGENGTVVADILEARTTHSAQWSSQPGPSPIWLCIDV
eukprot:PhM_4_TR14133/c5_g3_i1/m.39457